MIFFQRGEGWDHAPVLIHPDVEERHREQVKREITADRLLEF